jgi:hypothetical protein
VEDVILWSLPYVGERRRGTCTTLSRMEQRKQRLLWSMIRLMMKNTTTMKSHQSVSSLMKLQKSSFFVISTAT